MISNRNFNLCYILSQQSELKKSFKKTLVLSIHKEQCMCQMSWHLDYDRKEKETEKYLFLNVTV